MIVPETTTQAAQPKFNWLALLQGIFGVAEVVIPIFIHNPKSQQLEAVVLTTAAGALSVVGAVAPPLANVAPKP